MYVGPHSSSTASKANQNRPSLVNIAATSTAKVHFMVPLQRNGDLIGREECIRKLETKLCVPNKYCRVALVGLGGIGYATLPTFFSIILVILC